MKKSTGQKPAAKKPAKKSSPKKTARKPAPVGEVLLDETAFEFGLINMGVQLYLHLPLLAYFGAQEVEAAFAREFSRGYYGPETTRLVRRLGNIERVETEEGSVVPPQLFSLMRVKMRDRPPLMLDGLARVLLTMVESNSA
jgi:hypothetical protein